MKYEAPQVVHYGSIVQNTFSRSGITGATCVPGNKKGDYRVCELDKFCEYSCSN